ncbi:hypothetical protein AB0I28_07940 [Phytomonospora sp. NPDC050363]|uniref:hypothetical protein n=1 Tax=Phytomonospora sp. NPDC050363 TaxID=3155642 RepID=UPI0033D9BE9F
MRVRTALLCLALAAGTVLAPSAAQAGPSTSGLRPEPWRPWIQPEWTAPAGRYCDFPLGLEVVSQDVRSRVLQRHPDGSVKLEEYAGPLISEFVNLDTGERLLSDASGSGVAEFRTDGSYVAFAMAGPVGMGFRDGDRDLTRGYYMLDGVHVVAFAADGTRSLPVDLGGEDNVCDDLA